MIDEVSIREWKEDRVYSLFGEDASSGTVRVAVEAVCSDLSS